MSKTDEEIACLRLSGLLVSQTLAEVAKHIAPGVTTLALDRVAETFIRDHGGVPGFLGYGGFPKTLCTSVNREVVHGIPSKRVLIEGDIVSVDCGVLLNGFYGDSAYTFPVGSVSPEVMNLLRVTRQSLFAGIEKAVAGNRMGDISSAVQDTVTVHGYGVVRELVGHGIGRRLHESPDVPNYGKKGSGPKLIENMVLCIEPMITMGKAGIFQLDDGWTICTADGKPSAHFELTVAVKKGKPEVLSTFSFIEEESIGKNPIFAN